MTQNERKELVKRAESVRRAWAKYAKIEQDQIEAGERSKVVNAALHTADREYKEAVNDLFDFVKGQRGRA